MEYVLMIYIRQLNPPILEMQKKASLSPSKLCRRDLRNILIKVVYEKSGKDIFIITVYQLKKALGGKP